MRITIRIDHLVLPRVAALDAGRFQAALREELTRLVVAGGVPTGLQTPSRSDRVVIPAFPVRASSDEVGRACAQAVYGAFA